jgi:hypothetical protein
VGQLFVGCFAAIAPICCRCSDVRNSARNALADDIEYLAGFLLNRLTMSNKKMSDIATPIRATDQNESLSGIYRALQQSTSAY